MRRDWKDDHWPRRTHEVYSTRPMHWDGPMVASWLWAWGGTSSVDVATFSLSCLVFETFVLLVYTISNQLYYYESKWTSTVIQLDWWISFLVRFSTLTVIQKCTLDSVELFSHFRSVGDWRGTMNNGFRNLQLELYRWDWWRSKGCSRSLASEPCGWVPGIFETDDGSSPKDPVSSALGRATTRLFQVTVNLLASDNI